MNKVIFDIEPAEREQHAGKSLQLAMAIYDVTAAELAESMELTRQAVSKMINSRQIKEERLAHFLNYFGLTKDEFMALPHSPIAKAFDVFMSGVIKHFAENMPTKVKYLRTHEQSIKEISRTISMLEKA